LKLNASEQEFVMDPHMDPHVNPHLNAERFCRALGDAVVKIWSQLPPGIQHDLFEVAIAGQGNEVRSQLAMYLHDKHPRTCASIKARAMIEPDSLGG
jgi:RecJ-like exonuclease